MRRFFAGFGLAFGVVVSGCPALRPGAEHVAPHPSALASSADAGASRADASASVLDATAGRGAKVVSIPELPWSGYGRKKVGKDACDAAEDTVARAAEAVLRGTTQPAAQSTPWDRASAPLHLPRMQERFALTQSETKLLRKNGFAVAARLEQPGFTRAFHEIHQSQLPVYVSADAVFHAVFKSHEKVVSGLELELATRQGRVLDALHARLPAAMSNWPVEIGKDLDLYLTVARSLLADELVKGALGQDAAATELIKRARAANSGLTQVSLFGRSRIIDFSAFAPRGYYATAFDGGLAPYFRASMWLSRLEFNLVSRASRSSQPGIVANPAETPREAVVALALAELSKQAGVLDDLDVLESAWEALGGRREDVSVRQLLALRDKAQIQRLSLPASADALRAVIGNDFQRSARIHYMPQYSTPLPAIATLLGPRILPDAVALTHLVHADVSGRDLPTFADVAYVLGHDRAKHYLKLELARLPELQKQLDAGRAGLAKEVAPGMFGVWLESIRRLADEPRGQVPSFARTEAFRDARINSAVAAYGQLRHGAVLVAGQPYSEGGCEIPDGYVDPVPEVYAMLGEYARRGRALATRANATNAQKYFVRLERTLDVLAQIARNELAGRALSEAEKRWLAMVVEVEPPSSDSPGSFNGWYFDLFPDVDTAFAEENFVADYFTGSNTHTVAAFGAVAPRLGFFVVDVNGPPRVFVGPVAHAFELRTPITKRPKDSDKISAKRRIEPWFASHVAPAPRAPAVTVVGLGVDYVNDKAVHRFAVHSAAPVSIELLDHHRHVLARSQGGGARAYALASVASADASLAERVRVRVGGFSWEASSEAIGGFVHLSPRASSAQDAQASYDLRERLRERLLNVPNPRLPAHVGPTGRGSSM